MIIVFVEIVCVGWILFVELVGGIFLILNIGVFGVDVGIFIFLFG